MSAGADGPVAASGSWADVARPTIRMVRFGRRRHAGHMSTPRLPRQLGLLATAMLTLVGAANLIDVYGSVPVWAGAAVPATVLGSVAALAWRVPKFRLWWQLVFTAFAQLVAGPVLLLNETTIAHIVPTARTLADGWMSTLGSFKLLIAVDPPVGGMRGGPLAVWTACLWCSFFAGLFAMMDDDRFALAAAVPVLVNLSVCALLGSSAGHCRPAAGVIVVCTLTAWASMRFGLFEWRRWIAAALIMLIAAALAFGGCAMTARHRTILRDHYEPPLSPYAYASPLSGMRSYVKNHRDDVLLTVQDLPSGSAVRLAVMDRFDGNVWNLSDSTMAADSANYRRVGSSIENHATGRRFAARFTVHAGLRDYWLPLAGSASQVEFSESEDAESFYYNADTRSAIYAARTSDGLSYRETGIVSDAPTDRQLVRAKAAAVSQPEAEDVPGCVDSLATTLAGGRAAGGAAAKAIADGLRESGWFSHGLSGDYPSNAGHGNYRISQLLDGAAMVGDSEQYASAMALMARALGMSSRVVLGFLPKDDDGEISADRTEKRGAHTITEFTGNDVAAWVEIALDGYGWVAFHPTPKETKTPDENRNLMPPNPRKLVRQPPVPLTDPLRDDDRMSGGTSIGGSRADAPSADPFRQRIARIAMKVAVYGSPLWTALIVAMALLAVKTVMLHRARHRGDARLRIAEGWRSVTTLALQSGSAAPGTRREQARSIARRFDLDAMELLRLGMEADYAAFSGDVIEERQARDYWRRIDGVRDAMLRSLPLACRWMARLSLAGVFQPSHAGGRWTGRCRGWHGRRGMRGRNRNDAAGRDASDGLPSSATRRSSSRASKPHQAKSHKPQHKER